MGRNLGENKDFVPSAVANVREAGKFFVGKLLGGPFERKGKKGKLIVYELAVEDTDMSLQKKIDGKYVEASVKAGEKVSIFCPTVLAKHLGGAKVGERVRIESKGMNEEKGYYDFASEVL